MTDPRIRTYKRLVEEGARINHGILLALGLPGPFPSLAAVGDWAPSVLIGKPDAEPVESSTQAAERAALNKLEGHHRDHLRPESGLDRFARRLDNMMAGRPIRWGDPFLSNPYSVRGLSSDRDIARAALARVFLAATLGGGALARDIAGWQCDAHTAQQLLFGFLEEMSDTDPTGYDRARVHYYWLAMAPEGQVTEDDVAAVFVMPDDDCAE